MNASWEFMLHGWVSPGAGGCWSSANGLAICASTWLV
jgi:hypothetical protein